VVGPPLSQFYRYTSLYILLVTPKEISTELPPAISHQLVWYLEKHGYGSYE
jgi:hypothetical protein